MRDPPGTTAQHRCMPSWKPSYVRRVDSSEWPPGSLIPTEDSLCISYGVSRQCEDSRFGSPSSRAAIREWDDSPNERRFVRRSATGHRWGASGQPDGENRVNRSMDPQGLPRMFRGRNATGAAPSTSSCSWMRCAHRRARVRPWRRTKPSDDCAVVTMYSIGPAGLRNRGALVCTTRRCLAWPGRCRHNSVLSRAWHRHRQPGSTR